VPARVSLKSYSTRYAVVSVEALEFLEELLGEAFSTNHISSIMCIYTLT
jgi:hypothetical protein